MRSGTGLGRREQQLGAVTLDVAVAANLKELGYGG